MFFSSNDALLSFLSMQVENPNKKVGKNVSLSLFVQLFAFSISGHPDHDKLGSCRPIIDTQTKLESLITHVLFGKVQQTCNSVLRRIFEFAFEMMENVNHSSSRDQQGGITPSEQNFEYALCALVNMSLSFRWCMESNVDHNPYTNAAYACVNCELNEQTSILFRKMRHLKNAMSRLQSRLKFGSRMSHLISNWWNRLERCHCACSCVAVVEDEVLKSVKKIISFLKLDDLLLMNTKLKGSLSSFPPSSPYASPMSPKLTAQSLSTVLLQSPSSLDLEPSAPLHQLHSAKREVSTRWSNTRIGPPRDEKTTETLKTSTFHTCFEKIPRLLECLRCGVCGLDTENDGSE
jgi:hypothetical protein